MKNLLTLFMVNRTWVGSHCPGRVRVFVCLCACSVSLVSEALCQQCMFCESGGLQQRGCSWASRVTLFAAATHTSSVYTHTHAWTHACMKAQRELLSSFQAPKGPAEYSFSLCSTPATSLKSELLSRCLWKSVCLWCVCMCVCILVLWQWSSWMKWHAL